MRSIDLATLAQQMSDGTLHEHPKRVAEAIGQAALIVDEVEQLAEKGFLMVPTKKTEELSGLRLALFDFRRTLL